MTSRSLSCALVLWLAALVVVPGPLFGTGARASQTAAGPLEVIRSSNVRVTRIVRPGHAITAADRDEVARILTTVTDFAAVSASVLDARWASMAASEQRDFIAAFSRLISATAIAKMGRYRADRFEYVGEQITGDRGLVKTRAFYQGRRISLDYELVFGGGRWRIVNYSINGVDNAESYRRQFGKILEKETVADLIARIRRKIAETESGGQP